MTDGTLVASFWVHLIHGGILVQPKPGVIPRSKKRTQGYNTPERAYKVFGGTSSYQKEI